MFVAYLRRWESNVKMIIQVPQSTSIPVQFMVPPKAIVPQAAEAESKQN